MFSMIRVMVAEVMKIQGELVEGREEKVGQMIQDLTR